MSGISTYYGLTDQEWDSLIKLPAVNLLPCCPWVEDLRATLLFIYSLGDGLEIIERFLYQYKIVCDLHDMSYSEPLTHLAHHFRHNLTYGSEYFIHV